ncbi:MAG: threonine dehydratase [Planctomycetota bacterium]|jgi:threonine dehydratase
MSTHSDVLRAADRIRTHVRRTPTEASPALGSVGDCRVHLKLECQQLTGSFKLRGAFNKLLSMDEERRSRGVVSASTGNHGFGIAYAASKLGCPARIFVPENADAGKLERIVELGASIQYAGDDCAISELAGREFAEREGLEYVSPYNDPAVMAGQGTIGLELDQDVPNLDAVIVSVGGGGLAGGIAGYFAGVGRDVEVIGASPRNSCAMHASFEANRIVDVEHLPTLSDGTAGGIEAGSITYEACRSTMKEIVLVDEDEIARGMRDVLSIHHALIEGAAGTAVAAYRAIAERFQGKDVAILLCGANVSPKVLADVLSRS